MTKIIASIIASIIAASFVAFAGSAAAQTLPGFYDTNGLFNLRAGTVVAGGDGANYPATWNVASGGQYQSFVGNGSYTAPDSSTFDAVQQALTMFTASGAASGTGGTGGVSSTTLNISAMASGAFMPGCTLAGAGISGGPTVSAFGTSHGGTGTLVMSSAQTVSNGTTITCSGGAATYTAAGWTLYGASASPSIAPLVIPTWGGIRINPSLYAAYTQLTCNYGASGSLCPGNGPGLLVGGDIAGGDYLYFGASSNAGIEVLHLGPRLWGAYASLTLISSGYIGGAGNDSAAAHCGGATAAQCGSGYIVVQPDDTNQGSYGGAGGVAIYTHGSVAASGVGNFIVGSRCGVNTDCVRLTMIGSGSNNGYFGIGTEVSPQAPLVLSGNAATGHAFAGGAMFGVLAADGASTQTSYDTFNNGTASLEGIVNFRTARGTAASPANLSTNDLIGGIFATPFTNGGFPGNRTADVNFIFSDSSPNKGTSIIFDTTAGGTTTRAQAGRFMAGFIVGTSTTDPGAGNAFIGGNLTLASAAATVAAGQVSLGSTTVAAGAGTCPSGTVGGQTVAGCLVVNIAGTSRDLAFF